MARYAGACGWITRTATSLHEGVGSIENYVLNRKDIPEDVRKTLKEVQQQMNSAASRLYDCSRSLIETDAAGLSEEKEVDHEA